MSDPTITLEVTHHEAALIVTGLHWFARMAASLTSNTDMEDVYKGRTLMQAEQAVKMAKSIDSYLKRRGSAVYTEAGEGEVAREDDHTGHAGEHAGDSGVRTDEGVGVVVAGAPPVPTLRGSDGGDRKPEAGIVQADGSPVRGSEEGGER